MLLYFAFVTKLQYCLLMHFNRGAEAICMHYWRYDVSQSEAVITRRDIKSPT